MTKRRGDLSKLGWKTTEDAAVSCKHRLPLEMRTDAAEEKEAFFSVTSAN